MQAAAVEQEDAGVARLGLVDELDRCVEVGERLVGAPGAQRVQRALAVHGDDDGRGVDRAREIERVREPGVARGAVTVDLELRHREREQEAGAHEGHVGGRGCGAELVEGAAEHLGGFSRQPSVGEREALAERGPGPVRGGRGSSEVVGSAVVLAHLHP